MKVTHTNARDGNVILAIEDDAGTPHEITLNGIDTATFIGMLRSSLEEAIGHPAAGSMGLPGMKWVQYGENKEMVFFRIFLSDHVFHEYPVPKGTTLATELKAFADRVEARNLAKATHPPPDNPSGKPS